ncbi:hypothetical protein JMJ77_0000992, partial [Colletotrichum scovillei]
GPFVLHGRVHRLREAAILEVASLVRHLRIRIGIIHFDLGWLATWMTCPSSSHAMSQKNCQMSSIYSVTTCFVPLLLCAGASLY